MRIQLPWPPTVNTYWRRPTEGPLAGRTLISAKGREYRAAVCVAALTAGITRFGPARVGVVIHCFPPDARRRDLDNLPKSVLDALTLAGVWNDDSQIDDLRIVRHHRIAKGLIEVVIEELTEETYA